MSLVNVRYELDNIYLMRSKKHKKAQIDIWVNDYKSTWKKMDYIVYGSHSYISSKIALTRWLGKEKQKTEFRDSLERI